MYPMLPVLTLSKVIGVMQRSACPDMVYIEACMLHIWQNSCRDVNTVIVTNLYS